jgi:hypothetical protein
MRRINRSARMRKIAQKHRHSISRAKRIKRVFNALFHRSNQWSNETVYAAVSER